MERKGMSKAELQTVVLPTGYVSHYRVSDHFATLCGRGAAEARSVDLSGASCRVCQARAGERPTRTIRR